VKTFVSKLNRVVKEFKRHIKPPTQKPIHIGQ
jgi:hypothetical protein